MLDLMEDFHSVSPKSNDHQSDEDYVIERNVKADALEDRYEWQYIEKIGRLAMTKGDTAVARSHHKSESQVRSIRERYIAGPTDTHKSIQLKKLLKAKFDLFRDRALPVHDYILVEWVNQLKLDLGIKNLDLTTPSFIQKFKTENGIVSRKITKLVTTSRLQNHGQMLKDADEFIKKISGLIADGTYKDANVYNSDQTKVNFEMISNRTLSHKGELSTRN